MSAASVRALVILTDPIFFSQRKSIVDLATRSRLPAMYFFQSLQKGGGLVSYGPSDTDLYRRSATYVDRILHGAKPGELPIQQPTKFDLVINLKAANALGLNISPLLLARADKVIEEDCGLLQRMSLFLMLWTAPPPARECHGCGRC